MIKAFSMNSLLIFIGIWGITIAFLWFRPKIEIFWKFVATIIYLFYIWYFDDILFKGYDALMADWYKVTIDFLKNMLGMVFICLFFFWPSTLTVIFYKADDIGSERLLKFMCVLTIVIWIIFMLFLYFDKDIDEYIFKQLKEMISYTK